MKLDLPVKQIVFASWTFNAMAIIAIGLFCSNNGALAQGSDEYVVPDPMQGEYALQEDEQEEVDLCECCCEDDICTRSQLFGDWCGKRTCLAEHGIGFEADATLFYAGVTDGGVVREARFAGHND